MGCSERGPRGKATPADAYPGLEENGRVAEVGNPVQGTAQYRIQRLATADHLENKYNQVVTSLSMITGGRRVKSL